MISRPVIVAKVLKLIDQYNLSVRVLEIGKFLFSELECLEADFDKSSRREDIRGFWPNKQDHVNIDEFGGGKKTGAFFL